MASATLKDQGFRFMVSPDKQHGGWKHPLALPVGWIDCTDLSDDDFVALLTPSARTAQQLPAVG